MDDVELRERRVAAQGERERRDLLGAQLLERHVRERAVAAQAAGEQPEGLDVLELGCARGRTRTRHVWAQAKVVAEGDARARVVEQRLAERRARRVGERGARGDVERREHRVGDQHAREQHGVGGARLLGPRERAWSLAEHEGVAVQEAERARLVLEQRAAHVVLGARGQMAVERLDELDGHERRVRAQQVGERGLDAGLVVARAEALEAGAAEQRAWHAMRTPDRPRRFELRLRSVSVVLLASASHDACPLGAGRR